LRRRGRNPQARAALPGRVATAGEWQAHNRKELVSAENRRTVQDVAAGQAVRLPLPERDEDSSPSDLTAAAIAVPVMIADKLYAIAMYGPHVTGDDVDPLEVKALEDFSQQIGVGYETMKIKSLERENERLREQVSHVGLQAPKPA